MFGTRKNRFFLGLISMSFLTTGLSGCKNFEEVSDLGKRSEIIKATSVAIGKDFYQSCVNRANLPDSGFFPAIINTRKKTENLSNAKKNLLLLAKKLSKLTMC